MTAKPTPRKRRRPRVIVAGDVCIDWLSIPVDSLPLEPGPLPPMNWQLRQGRHMYAVRGGAWLSADFVGTAVGSAAEVLKPKRDARALANVPPEEIIHSLLMLGRGDRERDREKVPHWVVTHFDGYAGPSYPARPKVKAVLNDDPAAVVVLLDDAGNGFRDSTAAWPQALRPGHTPLVLYKVRRPLSTGALWDRLTAFHLGRTIALFSADELRGEGGSINRGLSWERTATDLIVSLARDPQFAGLRACPFLIVQLGLEGAVLVRCNDRKVRQAQLWFIPNFTEGQTLRMDRGDMSGFGSAFAAAIVGAVVKSKCYRKGNADEIASAISKGINEGLLVMHRLLEEAFGRCESRGQSQVPRYPIKEIFDASVEKTPMVVEVPLPNLDVLHSPDEMPTFRSWRILESTGKRVFADLAADVVRFGVDKVFADVPVGRFSDLATLDRSEIESYRSISNLIREFLGNPRPQRPLCLAVFGAPGSGKSFGVHQVARSLDAKVEKLDFNVSQWTSPEYLVNALHRVRDHALKGRVPLVFFDEFDSQFGEQQLGWLKYFLAPMQDGVFADGLFTHEIGKAILVFAGGTTASFAEFEELIETGKNQLVAARTAVDRSTDKLVNNHEGYRSAAADQRDDLKNAKLPDFVSRLRGHVNVFGVNPPVDTNLLRRALVLRSNIERKYTALIDASKTVRIKNGVLRAFLQGPDFRHGARSIEAILEMSHLVGRTHFDPSLLPPQHQLNLHVDGNAFMALVQQPRIPERALERMAKEIQKLYLKEELAKRDSQGNLRYKMEERPALHHWKDLSELYRKSNREQAAHYATMLAAGGCGFIEGDPDPKFNFSDKEVDKLARMEHERWVQERRLKQPDHPDLVTWEELNDEDKEKDIRTIEAIPSILGKVGLRVVRLS